MPTDKNIIWPNGFLILTDESQQDIKLFSSIIPRVTKIHTNDKVNILGIVRLLRVMHIIL